ncbi:MAG: PASTA domain-containing protein, partial [Crenarchaeota archaeon]|nr:PASTA domain-containing protein [Thermoproteota archaeon]
IDVSGEASGLLIPEASVKTVDLARIGFGQAIAVTPLELMVASAACVNGGYVVTPYLLDSVYGTDGRLVMKNYPVIKRQVITEQSSERVRKLLEGVVKEGSGRLAGVPGYSIAGKTGTAQKYKNGVIDRGKYLSSFLGFSTVENPEYMIFFMVDEPEGYLYYGSMVAAPYVGEIFAKIFEYKGIEPTEPVITYPEIVIPDLIGLSHVEAIRALKALGVHYEEDGEGDTVTSQFPYPGTIVTTKSAVFIALS